MLGSPGVLQKKPSYLLERQKGDTTRGGRESANAYYCVKLWCSGGGFTAISLSGTHLTFFWQLCNLAWMWLGRSWRWSLVQTHLAGWLGLAWPGCWGSRAFITPCSLRAPWNVEAESALPCWGLGLALYLFLWKVRFTACRPPDKTIVYLSNCHVHRSYWGSKEKSVGPGWGQRICISRKFCVLLLVLELLWESRG